MQNITVTGRLGRDAKIYTSNNGNEFIAFSIASNRRVKNEDKTYWWDVIIANVQRYRKMSEYLKKGAAVIVVGELDASIEKDNNGIDRLRLTINADGVHFNSTEGKSNNSNSNSSSNNNNSYNNTKASDDIPSMNNSSTVQTSQRSNNAASTPSQDRTIGEDDELPF